VLDKRGPGPRSSQPYPRVARKGGKQGEGGLSFFWGGRKKGRGKKPATTFAISSREGKGRGEGRKAYLRYANNERKRKSGSRRLSGGREERGRGGTEKEKSQSPGKAAPRPNSYSLAVSREKGSPFLQKSREKKERER